MLSILLPVFNFDVRPLVADLLRQCEASGAAHEIICFDDGSEEAFRHLNREIAAHENLTYRELPENIGRSAIRNALGKAARFPYLLFMDCDSKVVSESFIQTCLDHLSPGALLCGGRRLSSTPPSDPALLLHWKHGSQREQSTAQERRRTPHHAFMTNNFVVPRGIFLSVGFDETLRQYGHEDTLFGMELARRGIPILHLDNPLEHAGLEPAAVFFKKTKQGLENLAALRQAGKPVETRLLSVFEKLERWRLAGALRLAFRLLEGLLLRQLVSRQPSLRVFDFYKLGFFSTLRLPASRKREALENAPP